MMTTTTMLEGHQQLQQQQPHFFLNRVSTCDRHPDVPVTGFCASCLRERLAGLETTRNRTTTTTKGPSAAIKSIFSRNHNVTSSSSSSLLPGLRRCKSFSASGRGVTASAFEPQRKSCDVRGRNTLWSLFHQELDNNDGTGEIEMECKNVALGLGVLLPVAPPPVREEEEEEDEEFQDVMNAEEEEDEILDEREEVQEQEEEEIVQVDHEGKNASRGGGEKDEVEEAIKPMKEHIDLDSKKPTPKDLKEIAGSFWLAASVFSKKLQKWRRKQKLKKQHDGSDEGNNGKSGAMRRPVKSSLKPRRFFETQSEVAVDVFGRRSCDIDPRFSLDAGRMSFDDPRGSWDEPRASWDGYLIGGRSVFSSRLPSMLSVVEDVSVPAVQRSDGLIPVEEDIALPGGTAQTKDYYLDSSQRRRRSLDRSSSIKRPAAADVEEQKIVAAKAQSTVAGNVNVVHKMERDLRDSNSNSLRHDSSESFDFQKGGPPPPKKSRLWSKAWNIWGFIHRRSNGRNAGGGNGVERSMSESWTELRNEGYNRRLCRSNSSVSSRKEEFVLERNRSGRYSPGRNIDIGMPRFYLTPMSGSRRRGGMGKTRHKCSHAFTRTMMQLY